MGHSQRGLRGREARWRASALPSSRSRGVPSSATHPPEVASTPASTASSADLPAPLGPMTATNSPLRASSETRSSNESLAAAHGRVLGTESSHGAVRRRRTTSQKKNGVPTRDIVNHPGPPGLPRGADRELPASPRAVLRSGSLSRRRSRTGRRGSGICCSRPGRWSRRRPAHPASRFPSGRSGCPRLRTCG